MVKSVRHIELRVSDGPVVAHGYSSGGQTFLFWSDPLNLQGQKTLSMSITSRMQKQAHESVDALTIVARTAFRALLADGKLPPDTVLARDAAYQALLLAGRKIAALWGAEELENVKSSLCSDDKIASAQARKYLDHLWAGLDEHVALRDYRRSRTAAAGAV